MSTLENVQISFPVIVLPSWSKTETFIELNGAWSSAIFPLILKIEPYSVAFSVSVTTGLEIMNTGGVLSIS